MSSCCAEYVSFRRFRQSNSCTGHTDLTNPLLLSKCNLLLSSCNPPTPVLAIVEQRTVILLSVKFCGTKFFDKNMRTFRKFAERYWVEV